MSQRDTGSQPQRKLAAWPVTGASRAPPAQGVATASAAPKLAAWPASGASRAPPAPQGIATASATPSYAVAATSQAPTTPADPDLEWAIAESLRLSHAQEEVALATPGSMVRDGVLVPPDVGEAEPLSSLEAEYRNGAHAALWIAKLRALSRRYRAMRRVRGDGNCFYRSLWMGWMDRLLASPAAEQRSVWAERIPMVASLLEPHLPERLRAEFIALGEEFGKATRAVCEGAAGERGLLALARRAEDSVGLLRWLRLVASAEMRRSRETYEHLALDAPGGFERWLEAEVETADVEADEPQVQALAAALGVRVRVEYLDSKPSPWSSRCGPHRHVVCGRGDSEGGRALADGVTVAGVDDGGGDVSACLLFRPGHYDVLLPHQPEDPSLRDDLVDNPTFVPPLPPDIDAQPECGGCARRGVACYLCEGAACTDYDRCPRHVAPQQMPRCFAAGDDFSAATGSADGPPIAAVCSGCLSALPVLRWPPSPGGAAADRFALLRCGCSSLLMGGDEAIEHGASCWHAQQEASRQAARPTAEPDDDDVGTRGNSNPFYDPLVGSSTAARSMAATDSARGEAGRGRRGRWPAASDSADALGRPAVETAVNLENHDEPGGAVRVAEASDAGQPSAADQGDNDMSQLVSALVEMGFDAVASESAALRSGGSIEEALSILAAEPPTPTPTPTPGGPRTGARHSDHPRPGGGSASSTFDESERASHIASLQALLPGTTDQAAGRALDAAAVAARKSNPSALPLSGAALLEHASSLLFEPEEVAYLLQREQEEEAPAPSWVAEAEPQLDVDVPFQCRCGFTCGTAAAWQRHQARCSTLAAAAEAQAARAAERRGGEARWGAEAEARGGGATPPPDAEGMEGEGWL